MNEQLQTKQIQIIDIKPQFIQALNKTKYIISANDGIRYECWDQPWVMSHQVGTFTEIQFYIKQNTSNGKIYTNYIIHVPRGEYKQTQQTRIPTLQPQTPGKEPIEQILERLTILERNIIDAIRLHCGNNIQISEDSVPNISGVIQEANIPIIEDTANYTGKKNPF